MFPHLKKQPKLVGVLVKLCDGKYVTTDDYSGVPVGLSNILADLMDACGRYTLKLVDTYLLPDDVCVEVGCGLTKDNIRLDVTIHSGGIYIAGYVHLLYINTTLFVVVTLAKCPTRPLVVREFSSTNIDSLAEEIVSACIRESV